MTIKNYFVFIVILFPIRSICRCLAPNLIHIHLFTSPFEGLGGKLIDSSLSSHRYGFLAKVVTPVLSWYQNNGKEKEPSA